MVEREGREFVSSIESRIKQPYHVSLTHKSERVGNQAAGFTFIEAVEDSLFAGTTACEKTLVYKYDPELENGASSMWGTSLVLCGDMWRTFLIKH